MIPLLANPFKSSSLACVIAKARGTIQKRSVEQEELLRITVRLILCTSLVFSFQFKGSSSITAQTQNVPDCPPCYNNVSTLTNRHGPGATGRPRALITIDESTFLGSSQVDHVRTATQGAMNQWNTTTGPTGERGAYDFELTTDPSQADFIVRRGVVTAGAGCAIIDMSIYPHVITLSDSMLQRPTLYVQAAMGHEIAHRMGLGHRYGGPTQGGASDSDCLTVDSIMAEYEPVTNQDGTPNPYSCRPNTQGFDVTQNDVVQAHRNATNPQTCTIPGPPTAYANLGGGGEEDPCNGDPDCGGGGEECWLTCTQWCECVEMYQGTCYDERCEPPQCWYHCY